MIDCENFEFDIFDADEARGLAAIETGARLLNENRSTEAADVFATALNAAPDRKTKAYFSAEIAIRYSIAGMERESLEHINLAAALLPDEIYFSNVKARIQSGLRASFGTRETCDQTWLVITHPVLSVMP
jgi:hypothetical protein